MAQLFPTSGTNMMSYNSAVCTPHNGKHGHPKDSKIIGIFAFVSTVKIRVGRAWVVVLMLQPGVHKGLLCCLGLGTLRVCNSMGIKYTYSTTHPLCI
uniref:Uncharacterized protein n=1 Tax=Arundo donax TaxID=35708 RepID=A0A0A9CQ01_ARUDO